MAEDHSPTEGPDSSAVVEDEGSTTMGSFAHVKHIAVGVDIGSTTVKAVVCDPDSLDILWQDYQRHETRQPEKVLEFLVTIGKRFPEATDVRVLVTEGMGAHVHAHTSHGRRGTEVYRDYGLVEGICFSRFILP